jgi:nucleotide-binding universal stress UspA family protein
MPASRLLIVATTSVPHDALRPLVADLVDEEADVRVVSPASKLSPLQWLANEEDEARAQAEEIAEDVAAAVADEGSVEAEVGDTDPLQAAEDALRTFDADHLVVAVKEEEKASWLERASVEDGFERFGRPVTYVVVPE